jgi:hypothetical protein
VMTELSFEKVDQIWTATGAEHYYRTFPVEEGRWILYIHPFDDDRVPDRGVPVVAATYEIAQGFAQAFEDDAAADVMKIATRVASAARFLPKER